MEFRPVPSVDPDVCRRNAERAVSLGLPHVERAGHVAVVGGGPSLADHLDELRRWNGPIWAINETFMWLKARGIRSTFLTADPKPQPWLRADPGDRALVTIEGAPQLFAALSDAHVTTYRLAPDEIHCGPTTATAAPHLAVYIGQRSVTFFGCDSSFEGASHVYDQALPRDMITVRCGGRDYLTKPEFLLQADALAALCRELPAFCRHRSAGLMPALIRNPEREVVCGPAALLEAI